MGKKKAPTPTVIANVKQFWCYYCDTRHEDEYKLIQHQRSKHFLCKDCPQNAYGRNCLSLSGLVSHVRRSHRKEIKDVPGAIDGRTSLEVEVSAMNGIPQEALDEFKKKLAEEMQEAMASLPEGELAEAAPLSAHLRRDEAPAPEEPPQPEEPPMPQPTAWKPPERTHTPMMPHFAQLAQQLANQVHEEPTHSRKEEPSAFDPAMLAARIKAAQELQKRKDAGLEKDDEEERRAEDMRKRSRSRSRKGRDEPQEVGSVTFEVTGKLGMAVEPSSGIVAQVLPTGQAAKLGVQAGWQLESLDDIPFSPKILEEKNGSGKQYKITFLKKAKKEAPAGRGGRANSRSRGRRNLSRSKKPTRGSLKFRPRSMNRSRDRDEKNDKEIAERRQRGENRGREAPREDTRRDAPDDRRGGGGGRRDDDRRGGGGRDDRGGGRRDDDRRDDRRGNDRRGKSPLQVEDKKRKSKWDAEEVTPMPLMPEMSMGTKTELCMAFTEGLCTKGDMCVYAHNLRELAPGGYKPRLCPSFMRGGCPRMQSCLYAHSKEELPPQFKCILCRNYTSGFCRKQQICTLAHGEDEQQWFIKFMGEQQPRAPGGIAAPKAAGMVNPGSMMGGGGGAGMGDGGGMAANVMMAAESQLMQGKAIPGQLAIEAQQRAMKPLAPTYQARINLAKNPAMKATGMQAALNAGTAKSAGGMPMGMPGMRPPGIMSPGSLGPGSMMGGSPPGGMPGMGAMNPGAMNPGAMMGGSPGGMGAMAKGGPAVAPKAWRPPGMGGPVPNMSPPPGMGGMMGGMGSMGGMGGVESKASLAAAVPKGAAAPAIDMDNLEKQLPCVRFEMGGCTLGEDCPFSHAGAFNLT